MNIYFIIKPIGAHGLRKLRQSIESIFYKKKYTVFVLHTQKKGHAIALTQKAVLEKADLVVACGGDGTINEVAQVLVETEIPLAIVPLGSGNGIARHFKIPLSVSEALKIIKKNQLSEMDVGVVNGHYFFGNMGCALESHFIRKYQKNQWHGILAYGIAFMGALMRFKHQRLQIEFQKERREISPFVLLISNTNQQGYNFTLTPQAQSDDGLMDLFWMEKSTSFNKIKFINNALLKRELTSEGCNLYRLSNLTISLLSPGDYCVQIDGEYLPVASKKLEIKVLPKKLNVIVRYDQSETTHSKN